MSLSGNEAKVGCELPAVLEDARIGDAGGKGRGGDEADARDRLEPLARCGCPCRLIDFLRNFNAALWSRRFVT
jgi:hypothetical protein